VTLWSRKEQAILAFGSTAVWLKVQSARKSSAKGSLKISAPFWILLSDLPQYLLAFQWSSSFYACVPCSSSSSLVHQQSSISVAGSNSSRVNNHLTIKIVIAIPIKVTIFDVEHDPDILIVQSPKRWKPHDVFFLNVNQLSAREYRHCSLYCINIFPFFLLSNRNLSLITCIVRPERFPSSYYRERFRQQKRGVIF